MKIKIQKVVSRIRVLVNIQLVVIFSSIYAVEYERKTSVLMGAWVVLILISIGMFVLLREVKVLLKEDSTQNKPDQSEK
jgi:hypothetical protein